jgi:hypothetical protein
MSGSQLVRSNDDLARLVQDGFAVRIVNGFLVVDDIPYVDDAAQVQWGSFLCPLDLSGTATTPPTTHVMCFVGGIPRDQHGNPIKDLLNDGVEKWSAGDGLTAACGFSQKPEGGYQNFYDKITYYSAMVISPAQAVDPDASPYTFKPIETDEDDGVFNYVDTFSSRAGITELNDRLAVEKVVIIGLGGTGGHLLDALAKTPARTIHLYDSDHFRTHNAFRAPGAASLEDLAAGQTKVDYFTGKYSKMRRGIVPHPVNVTVDNVNELLSASFVFLTMDTGPDKKIIVETLIARSRSNVWSCIRSPAQSCSTRIEGCCFRGSLHGGVPRQRGTDRHLGGAECPPRPSGNRGRRDRSGKHVIAGAQRSANSPQELQKRPFPAVCSQQVKDDGSAGERPFWTVLTPSAKRNVGSASTSESACVDRSRIGPVLKRLWCHGRVSSVHDFRR